MNVSSVKVDRPWTTENPSLPCHRESHGVLGHPAAAPCLPRWPDASISDLRQRRDLLRRSRLLNCRLWHPSQADGIPQPLAERDGRTLRRKRSEGTSRSRRRAQRRAPETSSAGVRRVLQHGASPYIAWRRASGASHRCQTRQARSGSWTPSRGRPSPPIRLARCGLIGGFGGRDQLVRGGG